MIEINTRKSLQFYVLNFYLKGNGQSTHSKFNRAEIDELSESKIE